MEVAISKGEVGASLCVLERPPAIVRSSLVEVRSVTIVCAG